MLVIPAIDIINGRCVRLQKGDFSKATFYEKSPLEQAKKFEDLGYKHLHLVDLDGAKTGKPQNIKALKSIALNTNLLIDFGGGIRSCEDINRVINNGASQVNIGTILISNPVLAKLILDDFGSKKIIASIDCENLKVKTHGWIKSSNHDIFTAIESMIKIGFDWFSITDISKDGMLQGPAIDLYKNILERFPFIKLRASGGVSSFQDIELLKALNLEGVIVGKMLYEV